MVLHESVTDGGGTDTLTSGAAQLPGLLAEKLVIFGPPVVAGGLVAGGFVALVVVDGAVVAGAVVDELVDVNAAVVEAAEVEDSVTVVCVEVELQAAPMKDPAHTTAAIVDRRINR